MAKLFIISAVLVILFSHVWSVYKSQWLRGILKCGKLIASIFKEEEYITQETIRIRRQDQLALRIRRLVPFIATTESAESTSKSNIIQYLIIIWNYLVFGLCPSSGFLKTREHNVKETGSIPVLRWGGKTPTLLGRPVLWKLENTTFRKLDLFPSSGEGRSEERRVGKECSLWCRCRGGGGE
jgi:hypothetical protein